jgi:hypothetical protein
VDLFEQCHGIFEGTIFVAVFQNVECISRLWVIVFYVAYVFPVSNCQFSAGLAYICFVACFTCHFVYAAFVVFLRGILDFGFDRLLQGFCVFEGYLDVSLFEEVSYHSDFGAVVSTHLLLLLFLVVFNWVLCCICVLNLVMWWMGNLLLFAMVCIFCHSVLLFSVESGSDIILLIKWRYAAILCSVGWLEV